MSRLRLNVESMAFPDEPELIRDFPLDVASGEFVSLLGPSGSGKSTLLRIIAGLETRFRGKVEVGDQQVRKPNRNVQMVFQDYRLLPWKSVRDNLHFAVAREERERSNDNVQQWLNNTRLAEQADKMPKQLSGGEKSRAAFARAFISPPKLLLLDEPFSALDPVTRFDLQDALISALSNHPIAVLMISHSIRDAVFLSDKIHLLARDPLSIRQTFTVSNPRPRERIDVSLIEVANKIAQELRHT